MKNKIRKNRILLTSLLGLALVSTATIAYATWNFGVEKKDENVGLTMEVDGVSDKSIVLSASASNNKVIIAETDDVSGENYVNVTSREDALKLTLDTFKISFSTDTIKPTKINFSLVDNANINTIKVDSDYFGREPGDYQYIDLATTSLDLNTNSESNNVYTESTNKDTNLTIWDITNKVINFKWGRFFETTYNVGEQSVTTSKPSEFWNKKISEKESDEEKLVAIKHAKDERKTMSDSLTAKGKSLTLKITVDYTTK